MFEVTSLASEKIIEFLKDKDEKPSIRVMLAEGGCSGPALGLALDDEAKDNDDKFESAGLHFLIDKDLMEKVKPIKIDYQTSQYGEGFKIESSLPVKSCGSGTCCC